MPRFKSFAAIALPILAGSGLTSGQDCPADSTVTTTSTVHTPASPLIESTTTTETTTTWVISTTDGGPTGVSTSWSTVYTTITSETACGQAAYGNPVAPPATPTTWTYPTTCTAVAPIGYRKRQASAVVSSLQPLESVVLYTCLASDNSSSPATTPAPFVTGPNGPAGGAILVTLADSTTLSTSTLSDGSLEIFTVEDRQIYSSGSIFQTQSVLGSSFVGGSPRTTASSTTFSDGSVEIVTLVEQDVWTSGSIATSTSAVGTSFIPAAAQTTSYTTTLGGTVVVIGEELRDYLDSSGAIATSTSILYTSTIPGSSGVSSPSASSPASPSVSSPASPSVSSSASSSTSSSAAGPSVTVVSTTGTDGSLTPAGTLFISAPTGGTLTTLLTSALEDGATEYIGQRIFPTTSDGTVSTVTEPMGTFIKDASTPIPGYVTSSWTTVLSTSLPDGTLEFTTEWCYYDTSADSTVSIPEATLIINSQSRESDSLSTTTTVIDGTTSYIAEDIHTTSVYGGGVSTVTTNVGTYVVGPAASISSPTVTPTSDQSSPASSPTVTPSPVDCSLTTTTVSVTSPGTVPTVTSTFTDTSTITSTYTTTTYDNYIALTISTYTDTSTYYTPTLPVESQIATYTGTVSVSSAWGPAATASGYPLFRAYQNIDFPYEDLHVNGHATCNCDGSSDCFATGLSCRNGEGGFEDCANICVQYNNLGIQGTDVNYGQYHPCLGVVYEQSICWLKWAVPIGAPEVPGDECGATRDYITNSGILLNTTTNSFPGECAA